MNQPNKQKILEQVRKGRISKATAARKLGTSRKSIYKWLEKLPATELPLSSKTKRLTTQERILLEKKLHRVVVAHPGWGVRKLRTTLGDRRKLSLRTVWLALKRHGWQTPALRHVYALNYKTPKNNAEDVSIKLPRLNAYARKRMVEDVLIKGRKVKDAIREYGMSRKTYAKWKKEYLEAQKSGEVVVDTLNDRNPVGSAHPRAVNDQMEKVILGMAVEHPAWSSHVIAKNLLGQVGNHGVQGVLERSGLSKQEQRWAYARAQARKEELVPAIGTETNKFPEEQFIPNYAPAPPPAKTLWARLGRDVFLALAVSFATFLFFFYWIKLFETTPQAYWVGLSFASLSLFMGMFFFLYSLKYYLTLAIVLSFSQQSGKRETAEEPESWRKGLLPWLLGINREGNGNGKTGHPGPVGLEPNLEHIQLTRFPMISVQIPFYNEKNVAERAVVAACNMDYPEYEVIIADDSTDETSSIIRQFQEKYGPVKEKSGDGWTLSWVTVRKGLTLKHLHRSNRAGYKGAALDLALKHVDPKVEFITVFDADFVPYPDTLNLFLKYFKVQNHLSEDYQKSNVAVVQGYQWHVLNKSENWLTRGVRCEYAGSYVVERAGTELYGGLKMISGSVYMIRRQPLEEVGWGRSITEDFELTLKLYERGYKVVYTPYIQAPAECVSTLKRLIRQRMRWAEGHSNNIKKMFWRLLGSHRLTRVEKFEVVYLSPYYLQACLFLVGTLSWLLAETVFAARLPFWTSLWGWSLVLTNMLSLPLVNLVGLFLEESEEKDYIGLASFVALCYVIVPFQAYAAIKGFLEKEEGTWFRTPKTGIITDVFTRGRFYRLITGIFRGEKQPLPAPALSQISFSSDLNPYLALASANNQFNSFNVPRKRIRWVGKTVLVILLSLSVTFSGMAFNVKVAYANPDNFFLRTNASANVNTTPNISWQLDTTADTVSSTATSIKPGKNVTGTFQWKPGIGNNSTAGTPGTPNNMGWIRDSDMIGNTIASGQWSFITCTTDNNSPASGYLRALVWKVALTGTAPSMTISSSTLIYDSGTDFSLAADCGGGICDLWTATTNLNKTYTSPSASPIAQQTFDSTQKYLYMEFWNVIGIGPTNANGVISLNVGNVCTTNAQVQTPVVTVPENLVFLLPAIPIIPPLVMWVRKVQRGKMNIMRKRKKRG